MYHAASRTIFVFSSASEPKCLTTVLFGELSAFTESRSVNSSLHGCICAYYEPNSARNDWFPLRHPDVSPILQLPSIPGFSRDPTILFASIDAPGASETERTQTNLYEARFLSFPLSHSRANAPSIYVCRASSLVSLINILLFSPFCFISLYALSYLPCSQR